METIKIDALLEVIDTLRGPSGCPWDREQTPAKMGKYLVEEAYEAFYEIERGHAEAVCEELGDLLFLICFITSLYREEGAFDLNAVIGMAQAKMVRRHPHVFADGDAKTSDQVIDRWIEIKKAENKDKGEESILDSIPSNMAPLQRAHKISSRAAKARFDWPDLKSVMAKLDEEVAEVKSALAQDDTEAAQGEVGDVFFTLANVARHLGADPEHLTNMAVEKFEKRFRAMEKRILESGRTLREVTEAEKETIWQSVKAGGKPEPENYEIIYDFGNSFYE